MANPKIEVEIGSDIKGLRSGVDLAEKELNQLGAAAQSVAPKINKATQAASGFNSVGTDFARIIQDAPFGIIGVSNNITQLASSFGAAKASGASFGTILKGVFSAGNLVTLGISAITTALVLYEQGVFDSKEETKNLTDELEKYRESLQGVDKAILQGLGSAQKEIQSFQLLKAQAENANISLQDRTEAVKELQKQYPDYLGNLSQEQILSGNVGTAYDELTKSLIATAKARAASDQIAERSLNVLTLETQKAKLETKKLNEAQIQALKTAQGLGGAGIGTTAITQKDLLARGENLNISKQQAELDEQIKTENAEIAKLSEFITGQISQGAKFTKDTNTAKKEQIKLEDELILRLDAANRLRQESAGKLEKLAPELIKNEPIIQDINIGLSSAPLEDAISNADQKVIEGLSNVRNSLQNFNAEASAILENGVANGLGDLAFAFGDALASGANVIDSLGPVLLGSIASILNQLGQLAIATGVATEGIKVALTSLNPGLAIAGGIALVALAGFVSNKAKSLAGGGARGGSFSGASGVSQGTAFTGQGASALPFDRTLGLTGEFRVKGQDLVYVFNEASSKNARG